MVTSRSIFASIIPLVTLSLIACSGGGQGNADAGVAMDASAADFSATDAGVPPQKVLVGGTTNVALNLTPLVSSFTGTTNTISNGGSMDGAAAGATFYQPRSITADNINIYIADEMNHTIRQQVIATGVVSTLAGTTGVQGVADGTGTAATFSRPYGITTDGINLYVTDMNNYKIRKIVIATGVVTSLTGVPNTVMTAGSTDGTAMAARFDLLSSITTDGTSLYVADRGNNKIRKVVIATGIVSSQTGTVNAPMNEGSADGPAATATFGNAGLRGITTDGANLYVSDSKNNKIRKIVLATGVVSTLAGNLIPGAVDGTGAAASFSAPFGLTTDGTNLYIADAANYKIRQVVLATGAVTSLTGIPNTAGPRTVIDSTGSASTFDLPSDVTTDGTSLYVMDTGGQKIRKIQ